MKVYFSLLACVFLAVGCASKSSPVQKKEVSIEDELYGVIEQIETMEKALSEGIRPDAFEESRGIQ